MPAAHSFKLIYQPWLIVRGQNGKVEELGIQNLLWRAHEIAELRDASPLVTAALHRLLLAILHRALSGPKSLKAWSELWKAGRFPEEKIQAYLEEHASRFDLFDDKYPFYQVAGFELPKTSPVTKLTHEMASGNNATLFDHSIEDDVEAVPPAVCARWLVANQAFALGGGMGAISKMFGKHPNFSNGPLIGGALVLLLGENLFQTLMLNLLCDRGGELEYDEEDVPIWERKKPDSPQKSRLCRGYLDLLTWQSRCIRLVPSPDGIREMYYSQLSILDQESRPREPAWFYRVTAENQESPVRIEPGRALWRSSDSLFALQGGKERQRRPLAFKQAADAQSGGAALSSANRLRCMVLGLANDKAKVETWAHEELPVPIALLNDSNAYAYLVNALNISERSGTALRKALYMLAAHVLPQVGGAADKTSAGKFADSLQGEARYWSALELPFKQFLHGLAEQSTREAALANWGAKVWREAMDAFDQSSRNCLGGVAREQKARVSAGGWLAHELSQINSNPSTTGEKR